MIKQMTVLVLFYLTLFPATAKPAVSDGLPLALDETRLPNDSRLFDPVDVEKIQSAPGNVKDQCIEYEKKCRNKAV